MVAIASPSVLVCSVTAVTSSNMVTSRLMVHPSVADLRSLLLCSQLHRARRDGCCTRDAAIADPRSGSVVIPGLHQASTFTSPRGRPTHIKTYPSALSLAANSERCEHALHALHEWRRPAEKKG